MGLPTEFKKKKLNKGETVSFQEGQLTGVRWMDKRPVSALSTIHDASMTTVSRRSRAAEGGVERIRKPTMIVEYNTYMGGVDIADQLVTYYGFSHCSRKWWKRLFPPAGSVHGECIHHVLLQKPQEADTPGFRNNGFQTAH